MWQYQKTFTRYPSNSKTNVKNRCPELGAGAGIGPVTPASQRKRLPPVVFNVCLLEPAKVGESNFGFTNGICNAIRTDKKNK